MPGGAADLSHRARRKTVYGDGAIAQPGERLLCKQDVVGSIPTGSTTVTYGRNPCSLVAQLVEHSAVNRVVVGSRPTQGASSHDRHRAIRSAVDRLRDMEEVGGSTPPSPTMKPSACRGAILSRQPVSGRRLPGTPPVTRRDGLWGYSSVGRAPAWHAGGHRFDPVWLHHFLGPRRRGHGWIAQSGSAPGS